MRKWIWPLIILVKLVASKIIFLRKFFALMGFYSPGPGGFSNPTRFMNTLRSHYRLALAFRNKNPIQNVFELGPGGTDYAIVQASKLGLLKYDQVDSIAIREEVRNCKEKKFIEANKKFLKKALLAKEEDRYRYFSDGLKSVQAMPPSHYDFVYSNSVLQHVNIEEVNSLIDLFFALSKNGCVHSHFIDLRDCFSGGINSFRFSNEFWHSGLIKNSGFYTNRLDARSWLNLFQEKGFTVLAYDVKKSDKPLIRSSSVHQDLLMSEDMIRLDDISLTVQLLKDSG